VRELDVISDCAYTAMLNHQWAFLLHALVEIPACLNFFFFPDSQLSQPAPQAHLLLRQYALLLFCSAFIALVCALGPPEPLSGWIAAALAFYHFGPLIRSYRRITGQLKILRRSLFDDPWLHMSLHALCLVALVSVVWDLCVSIPASRTL